MENRKPLTYCGLEVVADGSLPDPLTICEGSSLRELQTIYSGLDRSATSMSVHPRVYDAYLLQVETHALRAVGLSDFKQRTYGRSSSLVRNPLFWFFLAS